MSLGRRLAAEGIGTALLLAAIIGSGIMGERLAAGNTAIALLASAIATGAVLVALTSLAIMLMRWLVRKRDTSKN